MLLFVSRQIPSANDAALFVSVNQDSDARQPNSIEPPETKEPSRTSMRPLRPAQYGQAMQVRPRGRTIVEPPEA